ncbi:MAG: SRPBCC family protein [Bacteroidales bacterium]|nr:SRPBCC family protein [Bacteroidales bacterium]
MKKTIIALALLILTFSIFNFYEKNSFNIYIKKTNKEKIMNIPINKDAPVKSKNQIEIKAPIKTVWKVLTDIKRWPKWQKAVTKTEIIGNIEEGKAFYWKADGLSFRSKIHTIKPYLAFGWTGTTIGASAIHNWTFIEKDNQTIVVVEESLQGIFPQLFKKYFQKNLDNGVLKNLQELKEYCESNMN